MHKGINCTYERNIYLSVRRIYGFTNGFLLIALANCESNEPYVNRIFSSTLTSFLTYLLLNNIFFSWSHGSSDVNGHTFCVFRLCPFSIFFLGTGGRDFHQSPIYILGNFEGLDKQAFSYFENLATFSANNKLSRAGN